MPGDGNVGDQSFWQPWDRGAGPGQVYPTDRSSLGGAILAAEARLIDPILIGPPDRIRAVASEMGVDISKEFPKPMTDEVVRAADVVITMGCGDACPIYPGKRYEDWELDDPAGQGVDAVREIRDEIDERVQRLVGELLA